MGVPAKGAYTTPSPSSWRDMRYPPMHWWGLVGLPPSRWSAPPWEAPCRLYGSGGPNGLTYRLSHLRIGGALQAYHHAGGLGAPYRPLHLCGGFLGYYCRALWGSIVAYHSRLLQFRGPSLVAWLLVSSPYDGTGINQCSPLTVRRGYAVA